MPRNTSVEDFLSLVDYGDIPAPDKDLLSQCVFPQSNAARVAAQAAVAFTGIGKSSAVHTAGGADEAAAARGAGAKRGRPAAEAAVGTDAAKLKQAKVER